MVRMMEFPDTPIVKNADKANYQNYLAWQAQTAARRRQSHTQFDIFQSKAVERMCSQQQFKEDIVREVESNKDAVERRLRTACQCDNCYYPKGRSNSDTSTFSSAPPSPTSSRRSMDSLSTRSSRSPPGTTVRNSTSPSARNSLVASSPPRSRHHQRACQREPEL